jgi:hypothetical protein
MNKIAITLIIISIFVTAVLADEWLGVWGITRNGSTPNPHQPILCDVQLESDEGDSDVHESYYKDDSTQYSYTYPSEVVWNREYDRVHAWTDGDDYEGYNNNSFTYTGGVVRRDVTLMRMLKE